MSNGRAALLADGVALPAGRDGLQLLSAQELVESSTSLVVPIPLGLIDPNPKNPRQRLPEVDQLAENILAFGLMQAIFVRRAPDDRYEVLSGHRRRAAFLWLHQQYPFDDRWLAIPAMVVSADDDRSELMMISAQAHIAAWKPREQAAALERLALTGLTLAEIGRRLNRTESWTSRRVRVFADDVLSGYVQSGLLKPGVAEELLPIRDLEGRKQFAERAVTEDWSLERARREVRAAKANLRPGIDIAEKARELVDLLSRVDGQSITVDIFRDLWVLHGRVESLSAQARGSEPMMPTIAEAERAAGISERPRRPYRTQARRKPGYKPRY